jgi:hypothetical protein
VRRVVWTGLALLLLLGGYGAAWWYFSEFSRKMIVAWINGLPADRITLSPGEMRRGGFPFALRWTFAGPKVDALWALGDVSAQAASLSIWLEIWRPSRIQFHAVQPGSVTHHGPSGRAWGLGMTSLSGVVEIVEPGTVDVRYAASEALLDEVEPGNPSAVVRRVGAAATARGAARGPDIPAAADQPPSHSASITLEGVTIPKSRRLVAGESGRVQALFTLRGGIGDGSIEDLVAWRDAGGVLEIEKLDIDWIPIELEFESTLALDARLRLLGAGTANIRGLPGLIDRLVERGDIKRSDATVTKLALALLTRPAKDGGAAVVRLPLTAQNGSLRAGPFVLGRLPSIIR